MKKVTRIIGAICMMGLLTFVTTSCKKNVENEEATISVNAPDFEEEGGERAYINSSNKFMWHEQDQIRVYNLADELNADESMASVFDKIGTGSTSTARFRGPSVGAKKAEGFRFFYPVGMVKGTPEEVIETLGNQNRQIFKVAKKQQYHMYSSPTHHLSKVDPLAMPMAVEPNKLTDNVNLKHMFGVAVFRISGAEGTAHVIDSAVLEDKHFNISGEVSVKLHKAAIDLSENPAEYTLNYVWKKYNDEHGLTTAFLEALATELQYLGWMPDYATTSKCITLDCRYDHDGTVQGVDLPEYPQFVDFDFMLRPLALGEGFTLKLYSAGTLVADLDDTDFRYGIGPCDYTWAVKAGKLKVYNCDPLIP